MMLPYIINVALILAVCLAFYKLLLRRETFYKVNRLMLIICLAISFALPLLQVPPQFSLRNSPDKALAVASQHSAVNSGQDAANNGIAAKTTTIETKGEQTNSNTLPSHNSRFTFDKLMNCL